MTRPLQVAVLVALLALGWGAWRGHRASVADRGRASAEASAALYQQIEAGAVRRADSLQGRLRVSQLAADSAGVRAVRAEARARVPVSVTPPLPTAPDSLRYWVQTAQDRQDRLTSAFDALQERATEVTRLRAALTDQEAASAQLRGALAAADARGDTLASALHRMPSACRKFLGLIPYPKVVAGYGAGLGQGVVRTGPQVTVGWSLVGC